MAELNEVICRVTWDSLWHNCPAQAQQRCAQCLPGSLETRDTVKPAFVKQFWGLWWKGWRSGYLPFPINMGTNPADKSGAGHSQSLGHLCVLLVSQPHWDVLSNVLPFGPSAPCAALGVNYWLSDFPLSFQRTSLSALERSEQQIRRASSLEELLHITHSEDWKLWKCRLKLKSLANLDSRSASHRSTRFAAAFYDIDTLKGRCRFGAKAELSFKTPPWFLCSKLWSE